MAIDANTGEILHNQGGDQEVFPASLTKMMTLYMTFELIELGRMNYASKIKMTPEGAARAPSKLNMKPGEELTVQEAIKALVTKSANDVATALAQHIGGTEANFARLMTAKAREIGMTRTTFRNASGLPDPDQTTTARDMLTLGLRLQDDFPRHYKLFNTRTFSFSGKTYRNHNTLLRTYEGTDGIKTGYTRASGFNLVSSVRRDGKHVVAAVFGGKTARARNATMQRVLSSALAKASRNKTRKPALVARAPQPKPVRQNQRVAEAPVRAPQPQPLPPPAPTAPAAAAPERPNKIAVARVRPVLMGNSTTAGSEAPPPEAPRFATAGATALPPAQHENYARAQQAFPRFVPETGALRPSTLQAQAAHLEAASGPALAPPQQPPPQQVAARMPSPRPSAPTGDFQIQIGAYANVAEAERRMNAARARAPDLLGSYTSFAMPVASGSSTLYRARFAGFDSAGATRTCSQLRSMQIDCFVTRGQ